MVDKAGGAGSSDGASGSDAAMMKAFDKAVAAWFKGHIPSLLKSNANDEANRKADEKDQAAWAEAMGPDGDGIAPEPEQRKGLA